ncbi:hypothetical protein B5X24_HaOG203797 [Helicoverpa armigera]|nr:hypothetical protein B5X24_HaOG203797 [Helicoverpa armigera]
MKYFNLVVLLLLVFYTVEAEVKSLSVPPKVVACNFYKAKLSQLKSAGLSPQEATRLEVEIKKNIKMYCEDQ